MSKLLELLTKTGMVAQLEKDAKELNRVIENAKSVRDALEEIDADKYLIDSADIAICEEIKVLKKLRVQIAELNLRIAKLDLEIFEQD